MVYAEQCDFFNYYFYFADKKKEVLETFTVETRELGSSSLSSAQQWRGKCSAYVPQASSYILAFSLFIIIVNEWAPVKLKLPF